MIPAKTNNKKGRSEFVFDTIPWTNSPHVSRVRTLDESSVLSNVEHLLENKSELMLQLSDWSIIARKVFENFQHRTCNLHPLPHACRYPIRLKYLRVDISFTLLSNKRYPIKLNLFNWRECLHKIATKNSDKTSN